jgi:hypothetical protein
MQPQGAMLLTSLALEAAGASPGDTAAAAPPTVVVPGLGRVVGVVSEHSSQVAVFRGIPYAEPPTGQRRWSPPVPKAPWQPATINATAFGSSCIQNNKPADADHGESCLFLNVWTPAGAMGTSSKLPVLLFVHGGGYNIGSGNLEMVGIVSASGGSVIAVSINYRLNIFVRASPCACISLFAWWPSHTAKRCCRASWVGTRSPRARTARAPETSAWPTSAWR